MTMPNDPEQPERSEVYAFPHLEMDPETFGKTALLRSDILGMPSQDPFKPAPTEYYEQQPKAEERPDTRLLDELIDQLTRRRKQLARNRRDASSYSSTAYMAKVEGQSEENQRVLRAVRSMKEALQ